MSRQSIDVMLNEKPDGSSEGRPGGLMVQEGSGETNEDLWFSLESGVLVDYVKKEFYEGTTAMSGQMSMTIPETRDMTYRLQLIDYSQNSD